MKKTIRLLDLAVDRLAPLERRRIEALIVCGDILVNGEKIRDPKAQVPTESIIKPIADDLNDRFVSRGGLKLEAALATWPVEVDGLVWIDGGASTGGFTHCLLERGASLVYAVDVGYNQLDYRLRVDPRVVSMERTRIQDVGVLEPKPHRAVADLSFRSIVGVARDILQLTSSGEGIFLIKPQFERDARNEVQRSIDEPGGAFDGVIGDISVRKAVFTRTLKALDSEGIDVLNSMESPTHGRKGNVEYLCWVKLK